jgi:NodT family efflux transporter outer membrane factor (OMF) lipoprotein
VFGVLAGCAATSGIKPQSAELQPAAVQFDADAALDGKGFARGAWPDARWWEMFGDAQLSRLIDEGLADSPGIRGAEARVREANGYAQVAGAARLPSLEAQGSVTRERFTENSYFPPPFGGGWYTEGTLQLDFNYDFDFWGRNRDLLSAAISEARSVRVDAAGARLVLSSAVAQAYFKLQADLDSQRIAREVAAQRGAIEQLTREREQQGLDSELSVRQAQADVSSVKTDLAALEAATRVDRDQLAALLGKGPDRGNAIADPAAHAEGAFPLPAHLSADLLGRRPDIVASRLRAEAAAVRIDAAKAEFYPDVNLAAVVGLDSLGLGRLFNAGSTTASVGPAVHLPIFEGGRLRGNLAAQTAAYDMAVEQYNQTLIVAVRQVADELAQVQGLDRQRAQQAQTLRATQQAFELALQRYGAGLSNHLELLIAQQRLLTERNANVQLAAARLEALVRLIQALGGGYREPAVDATQAGGTHG